MSPWDDEFDWSEDDYSYPWSGGYSQPEEGGTSPWNGIESTPDSGNRRRRETEGNTVPGQPGSGNAQDSSEEKTSGDL